MSFAKWKKRTKLLTVDRSSYAWHEAESIAQAAYKAGERDGRKQVEVMARAAIALRDKIKEMSK
jgi:hypothetical protein